MTSHIADFGKNYPIAIIAGLALIRLENRRIAVLIRVHLDEKEEEKKRKRVLLFSNMEFIYKAAELKKLKACPVLVSIKCEPMVTITMP